MRIDTYSDKVAKLCSRIIDLPHSLSLLFSTLSRSFDPFALDAEETRSVTTCAGKRGVILLCSRNYNVDGATRSLLFKLMHVAFLCVFYAFLFVYTKGPCSGRNTEKTSGDSYTPRRVVLLQRAHPTMRRHPCLRGVDATPCSCFLVYFLVWSATSDCSHFFSLSKVLSFFLSFIFYIIDYNCPSFNK